MYYVYIIRSESRPEKKYVGRTINLKKRIKDHNDGYSKFTKNYRPWIMETYLAFTSFEKARDFERYLKEGGGWQFAKRRLLG